MRRGRQRRLGTRKNYNSWRVVWALLVHLWFSAGRASTTACWKRPRVGCVSNQVAEKLHHYTNKQWQPSLTTRLARQNKYKSSTSSNPPPCIATNDRPNLTGYRHQHIHRAGQNYRYYRARIHVNEEHHVAAENTHARQSFMNTVPSDTPPSTSTLPR